MRSVSNVVSLRLVSVSSVPICYKVLGVTTRGNFSLMGMRFPVVLLSLRRVALLVYYKVFLGVVLSLLLPSVVGLLTGTVTRDTCLRMFVKV